MKLIPSCCQIQFEKLLVIKRYIFLILVGFGVLTGCHTQRDTHPNIIIIYADDLGYGDISCQNSESKIRTPNIDKLAQDGIRFTDAHSSAAICTPSRYSLLTGRYCWRTELQKGVLWSWDKPLISKDRITLPLMLKDKGYQTAAIGKWHLGWIWPTTDNISAKENDGQNVNYNKPITGGPNDCGFDYYFGDDVPNFPPYTFIENDRVTVVPTIEKPDSLFGEKGLMVENWRLDQVMPEITKRAVNYIRSASKNEQAFFLYFPLTAPHDPVAPTDQFKGTSQAGLYGDYVQEIDWTIGQIIQALEYNKLDKNTLIIFTSDNGSRGGDGTNWLGKIGSVKRFGHSPNGNLRGYKGDIWEAGHRVPFILKWPAKMKPGQVRDDLICQVDIFATLANIVGYTLSENSAEDSYDFSTLFLGDTSKNSIRKQLVNHSVDGSFAMRQGDWKLIFTNRSGGMSDGLYPEGFGITTPGQLYNLKNDIGEQHNLYKDYPEIVEELTTLFNDIRKNEKRSE